MEKRQLITIFGLLVFALMGFKSLSSHTVKVTCYNAVPEQTNADYLHTASNKLIDITDPLRHRWIAVSRDLEKHGFTFGKKVVIQGIGEYSGTWEIQDRMNRRWTNRIDLLVGEDDYIASWEDVTITLIK